MASSARADSDSQVEGEVEMGNKSRWMLIDPGASRENTLELAKERFEVSGETACTLWRSGNGRYREDELLRLDRDALETSEIRSRGPASATRRRSPR
jgi:hypothetical protein